MNILKNNSICQLFCLSLFVVCNAGQLVDAAPWQDDPFDPFATDDPNVEVIQPAGDANDLTLDESLSDGKQLVIRSVRESNPSTPLELARAIKVMLNIDQFGEAKRYLDSLIGLNLTQSQMFELSEEMGAPFLLDLRSESELQPQGRVFAEQVIRIAREEAFSPNRIGELISELSDDNKFVRQGAFRKLQTLGAPAVRSMLEVCEDQNRKLEIPYVSSALKQMGSSALLPLIGAARADGTVAQAVAAGALSNINSIFATDALLRMSISSRVPNSVKQIAADAVAERGLISPADIEKRIFARANDYLEGRAKIPAELGGQVTIYHWHFAQKKLIETTTTPENAIRIMSVDLARDLFSLNSGNAEYRKLQLITVLEATKRVIGASHSVLPQEVATFVPDLNLADIEIALRDAMDRNLLPAAIGAAEVAGGLGDLGLLASENGKYSTLVQAVVSGYRPLQFAAAKAIMELDPQKPFVGCSYVGQFLVLLANTGGNSTAVAVHPRADVAQAVATSIFQSGRTGLTANSSIQLFDVINSDPDVDFVVITDSISRPHYQELVQQLRSYWLSSKMPIALLMRNQESERQVKIVLGDDPLTLVMPFTTDAKLVNAQLSRLTRLLPDFPVSNAQRELQSQFALEWIARIFANEKTYRFYEMSRYRERIADLMRFPSDFATKQAVLAKLGTPASQQILIDFASDQAIDLEDRKLLVDGLSESVRRSGILLNRTEIKRQYDRFDNNSSDSEREILGAILNVLEARTLGKAAKVSRTRAE